MDRINRLIHDDEYVMCIEKIIAAENGRIFCRHGFSHCMDVARIGYIVSLEEGLDFDKPVIYAMALLHDIGRCEEYESNVPHHTAGAVIARRILKRCGYSDADTEAICLAIEQHKHEGGAEASKSLGNLLYRADKLSRDCFACSAYDECYWTEETKNNQIVI